MPLGNVGNTYRGGGTQTGHRFKLDTAVKIKDNNCKIFLSRSSYVKFNATTDENNSSPVSALFNTLSLQKKIPPKMRNFFCR